VAAYYLVSEALTNTTRHQHALVTEGDAEASGSALGVNRIEAVGGTFSVHSPVGSGTALACKVPV
jgi:signal transduction histidine kinase